MQDGTRGRGFGVDSSLIRVGDSSEEILKVTEEAKPEFTLMKNSENSKWFNFLRESSLEKITSWCRLPVGDVPKNKNAGEES